MPYPLSSTRIPLAVSVIRQYLAQSSPPAHGRAIILQELQEDKNGLEREEVCILAEAIQAVNGKWARVGSLILEFLLAMLIPLGIL